MDDADTVLLAIAPDDQTLHVTTAADMALHLAGEGGLRSTTLEFYDSAGRRWVPALAKREPVLRPDPGGDKLDEPVLLGRIDVALANLQEVLDRGGKPADRLVGGGEVPRPTGPLPAVLDALRVAFGGLADPGTSGNWLHMLAHAAGTAH